MPDLTAIGAALSSLKTATDIVTFLRQSDVSLERAEMKLKLAELISALAEAKIELIDVQELLAKKDRRIDELEDAFQSKDTVVRHGDAYYVFDESGKPTGIPFCLRCWENEHKRRQLVHDAKSGHERICTTCGHRYAARQVFEIRE